MFRHRKTLATILLVFSIFCAARTTLANYAEAPGSARLSAAKFYRTELYFGTNIKGGGTVSAEAWDKFLETVVTPRFPDGFTVFDGYGQFKNSAGKLVREASKVFVVFYPKQSRKTVDQKIEEIRAEYKKQFDQESVLRLDFTKNVEVSFK